MPANREEAEALYQQVLNLNPKNVNALHNLGLLILERGLSGAALPYLKYANELNPKVAEVRQYLRQRPVECRFQGRSGG